jgi:hypothetical protein
LRDEFEQIRVDFMTAKKRGPGRPKVQPETETVTLAFPSEHLREAEALVSHFDNASALGVRHTRIDVLRAAVAKGLEALRAQVKS